MRLNLSLRQRISFGFMLITLLVLVASGLGLWFTTSVQRTSDITLEGIQNVQAVANLEQEWTEILRTVDNMLLTRQTNLINTVRGQLIEFGFRLTSLQDQSPIHTVSTIDSHQKVVNSLHNLGESQIDEINELLTAARNGRWATAQVIRHTAVAPLQERFETSLNEHRQNIQADISAGIAALSDVQSQTRNSWLVAGVLTFGIGAILGVAITNSIVQPLNQLAEQTNQVIHQDFSPITPLTTEDELGKLSRAFAQMTEWLREFYFELQRRVDDRTRELALAAEAGRIISQVRDINTLLSEAVELIGSRFNLYHTQIYLMDENRLSLVLQAGTGIAGEDLVRRGHRLPATPGSVNGLAAVRREAIIVPDSSKSNLYQPSPLLPNTLSEMAIPLLLGNEVVGVLDLHSDQINGLTKENLPAFDALAGQLGIAIQNARLFTALEQARQETEKQSRLLTRENWDDFFDGVKQPNYLTSQLSVPQPETKSLFIPEQLVRTPITLAGEPIGELLVTSPQWSEEQHKLLNTVANQVAQRVENLRLLAITNHYRQQAEEANRRLTREGWQNFAPENSPESIGYTYDLERVSPLVSTQSSIPASFMQPLKVRDEVIGLLEVAGIPTTIPYTQNLLEGVAQQLSSHLENLRLTRETEVALAETAALYTASRELNRTNSYIEILNVVYDHTMLATADNVSLNYFEKPWLIENPPEWVDVLARKTHLPLDRLQNRYPLTSFPSANRLLHPKNPTLITNVATDPRLDANLRQLYQHQFGAASTIFIPIESGGQWTGYINAIFLEPTAFPDAEVQKMMGLVRQASVAVQNLRSRELAEQRARETQKRNEELGLLNQLVSSISSSLDLKQNLHTVAETIVQTFQIGHCGIALLNQEQTALIVVADSSLDLNESSEVGVVIDLENNIISQEIIKTHKPIAINDPQNDPRMASAHELMRRRRTRTLYIYPLTIGNDLIGTVGLDLLEENRSFTTEELQLINTIFLQTSTSIQQSRLFEQIEATLAETSALYSVTAKLNQVVNIQELVEAVTIPAIPNKVDGVDLFLIEQNEAGEPEWMVYTAQWERTGASILPLGIRFHLPDFPLARLWFATTIEPTFIEDVSTDERIDLVSQNAFAQSKIKSTTIMPLLTPNKPLGLILLRWKEPHNFTEEERRLYRALTSQATTVLDRLSLVEETQRQATEVAQALARTEVLYQGSEQIVRSTSPSEILQALVTNTALEKLEQVSLVFFTESWKETPPEKIQMVAQWQKNNQFPMIPVGQISLLKGFAFQELLHEGKIRFYSDLLMAADVEEKTRQRLVQDFGVRSVGLFPLVAGTEWFGFLATYSSQSQDLTEDEVRQTVSLVEQAAVVIQNRRLFDQTQAQARRERILRQVTERVRNATDVETIMRIAAREVGMALDRQTFVYLGDELMPALTVSAND